MTAEVFDRLIDWDMRNQLQRATRKANWAAEESKKPQCGRCHWWMKSKDCPAEKNVNGTSRGPSSDSNLALSCSKFQRSRRAEEFTEMLLEEATQTAAAKSFDDLPTRR